MTRAHRAATACAFAALAFGGCADDESRLLFCPDSPIGWIEGTVVDAAGAAGVEITAEAARPYEPGGLASGTRITSWTDSTGTYRMAVPPGRWWVGAHGSYHGETLDPVRYQSDARQYGVSAGGSARVDFSFGAVDIRLAAPPEIGPDWIHAVLVHLATEATWDFRESASSDSIRLWTERPVPVGEYRILVSTTDDERFWLPGTREVAEAAIFSVTAGNTVRESFRPSAGVARLRVVLAPVQEFGCGVRFLNADSVLVTSAYTGSEMHALVWLPEPVRIGVGSWRGSMRWIGGDSFREATLFSFGPGDSLDIRIPMGTCEARIEGGGLGAGLRLETPDGAAAGTFFLDRYPEPRFVAVNVAPGTYLVRIEPERGAFLNVPWILQWYDRVEQRAEATPITIPVEGGSVQLTMDLLTGGQILGSVRDPLGAPPSAAGVLLWTTDGSAPLGSVGIEEDGSFSLLGLADGAYRLQCYAVVDGTIYSRWSPGVSDPDSAAVYPIVDSGSVEGVAITVP